MRYTKDDWLYGFAHRGIGMCPECWLKHGFCKVAVRWRYDECGHRTEGAERDGWHSIVGENEFLAARVGGVKTCIDCKRDLEERALPLPGIIVDKAWSGDRQIKNFLVTHEGALLPQDGGTGSS